MCTAWCPVAFVIFTSYALYKTCNEWKTITKQTLYSWQSTRDYDSWTVYLMSFIVVYNIKNITHIYTIYTLCMSRGKIHFEHQQRGVLRQSPYNA